MLFEFFKSPKRMENIEWIDKTSNAPKSLYNKLRGASNQIIVNNHVQGQSKSLK